MISLIRTVTITTAIIAASTALAATPGPAVKTVSTTSACRASLTLADARVLAVETPNARAFVQNLNATLKTEVIGRTADTVTIRVTNAVNNEVIDVYTINLRTGHILDDAQEPAEDTQTAAVREKLVARHCAGK